MNIGDKIKNKRLILGLTQEELAERANLTKGFISQIERDLTSPSVDSLTDILEALGTNLSDFFKQTTDEKVVFNKDDMISAVDSEENTKLTWMVPNAQKNSMEPIMITLSKGSTSKTYMPYEGEDFGYVVEGKIELLLDKSSYILNKGECFYTKCQEARTLKNISKSDSKILWITNPPNF